MNTARYQEHIKAHARAVQNRVGNLGQKAYWLQFEKTPEFVVMFVPVEASVAVAFEEAPGLLGDALQRKVLIATPVTLLVLLKAVVPTVGNSRKFLRMRARFAREGKTLYDRIEKFFEHLNTLSRRLNQTVESYNKSVSSLEHRVLPSVRRFQYLGIADSELDALILLINQRASPPSPKE